MPCTLTRRAALIGMASAAQVVALRPALGQEPLVAVEIGRWPIPEANQAAAVDDTHFYGIGNRALVKHRKDTGERVAQWSSPKDGPIVHFNFGFVEGSRLVLSHSNFPQLPPASSLEIHDTRAAADREPQPGRAAGITHRRCGTSARGGPASRTTTTGDAARIRPAFDLFRAVRRPMADAALHGCSPRSSFPHRGDSSSSGGDWGADGLLYATGHDAPELHVMRLPRQGVALEHVTTIRVPFEGQGWAWDRSARGQRVIYGISRARKEVIAARIPALTADLLDR
jgi:hypothetical protein